MVMNRWNKTEATKFADSIGGGPADHVLAELVYATRLIGADKELVQHGGGNSSCKVTRRDVFGDEIEVLHIKGSGQDMADIDPSGMPAVRLAPLIRLRDLDHVSDADMVNTQRSNLLDSTAPTPSVETLLHAYIPAANIIHTHATMMLALADMPDAAAVVREIYGDKVAVVPFFMPGFRLGNAAAQAFEDNPDAEGLLLLNHGHVTFGADAKTAYDRMITHVNMAQDWLETKSGHTLERTGAPNEAVSDDAQALLPLLRGIIGDVSAEFTGNRDAAMPILDTRAGPNVTRFFARDDWQALAKRGVATPDHVIRTKNLPLVLTVDMVKAGRDAIKAAVDTYVADYTAYFSRNNARVGGGKIMLNPAPELVWVENVGILGVGVDAKAAAIAADLGEQNIAAMRMGEDCGGFQPVNEQDLFDMEYWSLEQAKIGRQNPEFTGHVVMVTGGGGAIGLATAQAFADLGANIFLVDLGPDALAKGLQQLGPDHGGIALDITAENAAQQAVAACISRFGGLDILVSNAGAAWTGEMSVLDDSLLRKSFELNFFAHQTFSKATIAVLEQQNRGGQILFNVSKQAVNPGKGFGAYGLPKAATFFLLRQLALELGPQGIRVNGINADRIRSGLLDDEFIKERAKARGIDEGTYMAGNLIRREVEAFHVGDAFVSLAQNRRTTAHVMTVDGGNIEAALR